MLRKLKINENNEEPKKHSISHHLKTVTQPLEDTTEESTISDNGLLFDNYMRHDSDLMTMSF
jgi:hypothetical protein